MPTVNGTLQLPGSIDPTDATVEITLIASVDGDAPGYYLAGDETIVGHYQPTVSATGTWSAALTANALITPANTVYRVTTRAPRFGPVVEYISVTNGAGPYRVEDILTSAPSALGDSYATTSVAAAKVDKHGGGNEYVETVAPSAGAATLDLAEGNVFDVTLNAAPVALTFTGATSGYACSFLLIARQDGGGGKTITWPASVKWPDGAPTLSSSGADIDMFAFTSVDGGTVWFGVTVGIGFA